MYLWRISNHPDLSGRGGLIASGRWHRRGNPVVYCSDHPATALLEVLVHFDPEDLPDTYQLLKVFCPDDIPVLSAPDTIDISDGDSTQAFGTSFLAEKQYCLLSIPSVVMPVATNYLINPAHPFSASIKIEAAEKYPFDRRLK